MNKIIIYGLLSLGVLTNNGFASEEKDSYLLNHCSNKKRKYEETKAADTDVQAQIQALDDALKKKYPLKQNCTSSYFQQLYKEYNVVNDIKQLSNFSNFNNKRILNIFSLRVIDDEHKRGNYLDYLYHKFKNDEKQAKFFWQFIKEYNSFISEDFNISSVVGKLLGIDIDINLQEIFSEMSKDKLDLAKEYLWVIFEDDDKLFLPSYLNRQDENLKN